MYTTQFGGNDPDYFFSSGLNDTEASPGNQTRKETRSGEILDVMSP